MRRDDDGTVTFGSGDATITIDENDLIDLGGAR